MCDKIHLKSWICFHPAVIYHWQMTSML